MSSSLGRNPLNERCRIACITDTFGVSTNNGVGRFLDDLGRRAEEDGLPLKIFAPGKETDTPNVHFSRAPSYSVLGYRDAPIALPLDHHRKTILRRLGDWQPDVLHVSTPGPFGCLGISLAQRLQTPVVGIYHTDFPRYAHEIALTKFLAWQREPAPFLDWASAVAPSFARTNFAECFADLQRLNPSLVGDVDELCAAAGRIWQSVGSGFDAAETAAGIVESIVVRALRLFYERFTLVIARSESQVADLQNTIGVPADRIRCLLPGTDTKRFHPDHSDRRVWTQFGVPSDAFVALYVGRISAEKNFQFLLNVWRQIISTEEAKRRNAHLVVAGHGDVAAFPAVAELPNLHIIGAQDTESIATLYASCDAVLFPSVTETLGQAGLEASASGAPLIASNEGGPTSYVIDNATGYLLPAATTEDARRWSEKTLQLMRESDLRRRIGAAACEHVQRNHNLQVSLHSYWSIHAEAARIHTQRQVADRRRRTRKRSTLRMNGGADAPGVMVITDFHAGKRTGAPSFRGVKEAAVERMLQYAVDHQLGVVFGGDFGDHGSRPSRLEADFGMLRRVQKRVGLHEPPTFVRGNHDYGFTDEQLIELTGGCRMHDSLVYYDDAARVTVTHGHILGLHQVIDQVCRCRERDELIQLLSEDALDEELKPSIIAYDLANQVESYTRQMGLTGLGKFWEELFQTRGAVAAAILNWAKRNNVDASTWKLFASLVGSHNDVQTAALLGDACGSWATVFGHTHKPLACRQAICFEGDKPLVTPSAPRRREASNRRRDRTCGNDKVEAARMHLVANAGNIIRKRPSCVVARFPELCVLRYRSSTDKLCVSHRVWLEESEAAEHQHPARPALQLGPPLTAEEDQLARA